MASFIPATEADLGKIKLYCLRDGVELRQVLEDLRITMACPVCKKEWKFTLAAALMPAAIEREIPGVIKPEPKREPPPARLVTKTIGGKTFHSLE